MPTLKRASNRPAPTSHACKGLRTDRLAHSIVGTVTQDGFAHHQYIVIFADCLLPLWVEAVRKLSEILQKKTAQSKIFRDFFASEGV
jgi:hypothetical protein